MRFSFEERRATQAAALLLRLSGGKQNYTWLLKVLYVVDRLSLRRTGAPISGASFCNMENGPLASDIYDCVKGRGVHPIWNEHIQKEGYEVALVKDPGDDELSDFDVRVLSRAFDRFKAYSYGRMIDYVHGLKEWKNPGATSETLLPEAIMKAAGADDDEIREFQEVNGSVNRAVALMS